jgi:hypothetical protein
LRQTEGEERSGKEDYFNIVIFVSESLHFHSINNPLQSIPTNVHRNKKFVEAGWKGQRIAEIKAETEER